MPGSLGEGSSETARSGHQYAWRSCFRRCDVGRTRRPWVCGTGSSGACALLGGLGARVLIRKASARQAMSGADRAFHRVIEQQELLHRGAIYLDCSRSVLLTTLPSVAGLLAGGGTKACGFFWGPDPAAACRASAVQDVATACAGGDASAAA